MVKNEQKPCAYLPLIFINSPFSLFIRYLCETYFILYICIKHTHIYIDLCVCVDAYVNIQCDSKMPLNLQNSKSH